MKTKSGERAGKTNKDLTGVSTFGKFEMLVGTARFVFDMVSLDGDG